MKRGKEPKSEKATPSALTPPTPPVAISGPVIINARGSVRKLKGRNVWRGTYRTGGISIVCESVNHQTVYETVMAAICTLGVRP